MKNFFKNTKFRFKQFFSQQSSQANIIDDDADDSARYLHILVSTIEQAERLRESDSIEEILPGIIGANGDYTLKLNNAGKLFLFHIITDSYVRARFQPIIKSFEEPYKVLSCSISLYTNENNPVLIAKTDEQFGPLNWLYDEPFNRTAKSAIRSAYKEAVAALEMKINALAVEQKQRKYPEPLQKEINQLNQIYAQ